jgi:serine/threonine-protein kinase RsbW
MDISATRVFASRAWVARWHEADRMIEMQLGLEQSELKLSLPAEEDSLPVVRQALRSLGETVGAQPESLEDAELAVTEACANVVEHAYPGACGAVEVTLCPSAAGIEVSVRDFGRGMPDASGFADGDRGYGLALIEGVASRFDVRHDGGTELAMHFGLESDGSAPVAGAVAAGDPSERILRRLVAVIAAQADLPTDRMVEALLVAELVARHGLAHLVGACLRIGIERTDGGFTLRVGPLEPGGARAVVAASGVPVVGLVIERLADTVSTETRPDGTEHLALGFVAG